jgi:hypothetical protein
MKKSLLLLMGLLTLGAGAGYYYAYLRPKSFEIVHPKVDQMKELIYGLGTVVSTKVYEHKLGYATAISKLSVRLGDFVPEKKPLIAFAGGTVLRAPFAGTITALPFHEGENIFPQLSVLRIEDLSAREIEIALEQTGALRVRLGQQALLNFESLRGETFQGKVRTLYPQQGQFIVAVTPDPLPEAIIPGMTVDVAIEVATREMATMIPTRSIQNGKITVLNDKKREKISIQVGLANGDWAEVLSPKLAPETQIMMPRK